MMRHIAQDQKAFTILELMIATMVFSVILLLVTTGILQIGKTYYKGALQSRTQETARNIIDEISRGIQFSGVAAATTTPLDVAATPYPKSGGKYGLCINGTSYAYVLDRQLASSPSGGDQADKALISYSGTCSGFMPQDVSSASGKELLGLGMRLADLDVKLVLGTTDTYNVTVGVGSGEYDLFNTNGAGIHDSCKGDTGSQFCAFSRLTTTVQKRVK